MPECTNCGEFVTPAFAQVFGDNADVVHGCLECTTNRRLDEQTQQHNSAESTGSPGVET